MRAIAFTTISSFEMKPRFENIVAIFKIIINSFYNLCGFGQKRSFVSYRRFGSYGCHEFVYFIRTSGCKTTWTKAICNVQRVENGREIIAPTFLTLQCISAIERHFTSRTIFLFYNIHLVKITFVLFFTAKIKQEIYKLIYLCRYCKK
jgi:hypothetical protein